MIFVFMQFTKGPHSDAICALTLGLCDYCDHPKKVEALDDAAYAEFNLWFPTFSAKYEEHKTSSGIRKMFGPTKNSSGIGARASGIVYTLYSVKGEGRKRAKFMADVVSEAAIRASDHKCLGFVTWSANTNEEAQEDVALSQGGLMIYSIYEAAKEIVRGFETMFLVSNGRGEEATEKTEQFVIVERTFAATLLAKCKGRIFKIQNGSRSSAIFGPYVFASLVPLTTFAQYSGKKQGIAGYRKGHGATDNQLVHDWGNHIALFLERLWTVAEDAATGKPVISGDIVTLQERPLLAVYGAIIFLLLGMHLPQSFPRLVHDLLQSGIRIR
jgi:hypothetical protein